MIVQEASKPDFLVLDGASPQVVVQMENKTELLVITSSGPPGQQGIDGTQGGTYTHTQLTPSASWLVIHNLGVYPVVAVYVDGEMGLADIEFIDLNTIAIPFPSAIAGVATVR